MIISRFIGVELFWRLIDRPNMEFKKSEFRMYETAIRPPEFSF